VSTEQRERVERQLSFAIGLLVGKQQTPLHSKFSRSVGASWVTIQSRVVFWASGRGLRSGQRPAKPSAQVICLHGDGSSEQNAMEFDTAVRHKLPLLCVISLNGGWTADPEHNKPRDLGYTRYDKMAEALGCYAEYVEEPEDT
jgi:TPP-dependent 2-oxoacid decarboxylase